MEEKKPNIFQKIKKAWKELDQETRDWLKVVGLWTVDGALIGTAITAGVKNKQMKKVAVEAYRMGQIEAYKEVIQEQPFALMEKGMRVAEKQNRVTKF